MNTNDKRCVGYGLEIRDKLLENGGSRQDAENISLVVQYYAAKTAEWKDELAANAFRDELEQFVKLLKMFRSDADGLIDVEASVKSFKKKLNTELKNEEYTEVF